MIRVQAVQRTGAVSLHGEGPVWDARRNRLHWVDMTVGDLLTVTLDESGASSAEAVRTRVGALAAAVRPRVDGGWIVATDNAFVLLDDDLRAQRVIPAFTGPEQRFNDGGCLPNGDFLCGTATSATGGGRVYRLDAELQVRLEFDGVTVSNGLGPSPDGERLYYVDTGTRRIDVFELDGGVLGARRPWVRFEPDAGEPDGLAVDAEGGVWVAMWGAGTIRRYGEDGTLSCLVDVPVTNPTACAFGGEGLRELFITTSRIEASDGGRAGALFSVDAGIAGLPVAAFAG